MPTPTAIRTAAALRAGVAELGPEVSATAASLSLDGGVLVVVPEADDAAPAPWPLPDADEDSAMGFGAGIVEEVDEGGAAFALCGGARRRNGLRHVV